MPLPRLTRLDPVLPARGIVLMLHGGAKSGQRPVGARSASFQRTTAMRDAIAPRIVEEGLSLWLLRFTVRGWNADEGPDPSPVPDARWALDQAAASQPGTPVVLLGHSMGARTAVHVADHPSVTGVVGLAPWLEPSDPVRRLAGKHLVAGHGSRDKITSARMTRSYVDQARGTAASAEFVDMGRLGHYMLHRSWDWNQLALRASLSIFERSRTRTDTPSTDVAAGGVAEAASVG